MSLGFGGLLHSLTLLVLSGLLAVPKGSRRLTWPLSILIVV